MVTFFLYIKAESVKKVLKSRKRLVVSNIMRTFAMSKGKKPMTTLFERF